ncbi:MAG TPA: methylated-DNA--[protein]-cysteine S-methyltransferase [Steroidobacteraceae bacterium]|nr:methylated-DNA--[protein]-cysteine S-methyltransferase [Steroidobacteraceae bacterium]
MRHYMEHASPAAGRDARVERSREAPMGRGREAPAGRGRDAGQSGQARAAVKARQARLVAQICRYIESAPTPPPLAQLARRAALSPFHFHRVFKAVTGVTPKAYAAAHRASRIRRGLGRAADAARAQRSAAARPSVTEAIYDAGFNSDSRFYESADRLLGMRAKEYRAGGAGVDIRFAVAQCSLGALLVAESARGICAISLGDEPEALVRALQDEFPRANLIGADAGFEQRVARVVGFIEDPSIGLDLPVDVRGTAFQRRVWSALRRIPAGTTVSYAQIARRLGQPAAVRAVAGACAANRIAVAIPCHRVVRSDGGLSGYRWGVERKRALLEREAGAQRPTRLSRALTPEAKPGAS